MALRSSARKVIPILKEVPLPAEVLSESGFAFPETLGNVPVIVRGKAYGEVAGQWYRVSFAKTIYDPSVVAIAQARLGAIPLPSAPPITIAPVTVSVVSAGVAQAGVPQATSITLPTIGSGHVPTSLGRFKCGSALTGITDGLNNLIITIESVFTRVNEVIDDLVKTATETVNSIKSLDAKVDDLRNKVNEALGTFGNNVNGAFSTLATNVQGPVNSALETLRKNTEDSINTGLRGAIQQLYVAWGLPTNIAITPVHVRNVTSSGFEFQSFGKTTVYYIAVGSFR